MFEAIFEFLQPYAGNPVSFLVFLLGHGGGLIFIPMLVKFGWDGWMNYIQEKWRRSHDYMLLQVEVPQLNEQSMKAVEQIFVQIYGSLDSPSREELYWLGFVQENFGFEIVSDGGYITFYIQLPRHYQQLVEAAFYAQYPDALLTEVDDYAPKLNADMIMNDKIEIWGSELNLANDDVMPIKSWPQWEHQLAQRSIDPLASILEVMTRLQPGEHWWFQILAQPVDHTEFRARAQAAIDELVDPDAASSGSGFGGAIMGILNGLHNEVAPWTAALDGEDGSSVSPEKRKRLTTPEREWIEEVDRKMSRWPYKTKIRWLYWAPPEIYDAYKGRRGMLGALQQFRFINWFTEGAVTRIQAGALPLRAIFPALRTKWRARRMMWAYQNRFMNRGEHTGFIMNTEELASLFHFPQIEVRAPFVTKAIARGVEPPTSLNFTDTFGNNPSIDTATVKMAGGNLEPTAAVPTANVVPERDATRNPMAAADEAITKAQDVLGGTGYKNTTTSVHTGAHATVGFQDSTSLAPSLEAPSVEALNTEQPVASPVTPVQPEATVQPIPQVSVSIEPTEPDNSDNSNPPSNLPFL